MAKNILKTLRCEHHETFKVCLAMLGFYKKRFLPEQLFPVKPSTQIHLYFPISFIHVEPAVHGFDKHSSISY